MRTGTNHEYIMSVVGELENPGGVMKSFEATRNSGIAMMIRLLEEIRDSVAPPDFTFSFDDPPKDLCDHEWVSSTSGFSCRKCNAYRQSFPTWDELNEDY